MKTTPDRDLLVLFKNRFMSQKAMEQEVGFLNKILRKAEKADQFCIANELVRRNRITQNPKKLLAALGEPELKPFWFFINKN